MQDQPLGKYLTLEEFCTPAPRPTRRYADQIDPYPKNLDEILPALEALCHHIIDPVIDEFGLGALSAHLWVLLSGFKAMVSEERSENRNKEWQGQP